MTATLRHLRAALVAAVFVLVGGRAVCQHETAWSWGRNDYGQLGDGTTTSRATPTPVPSFEGAAALAGGLYHSLALKADTTVWSWGRNASGQLGDGSTANRTSPVQVAGLPSVVAIAGGYSHSLALASDGSVWAWGANTSGQLGDGTTTNRLSPVQVAGLTGVVAVGAGGSHSVAVRGDGTVWCWGSNGSGQLGDGTNSSRAEPTQVGGLVDVVAADAGGSFTVAVKLDGTVWAWGSNTSFQLGDGTTTSRNSPAPVPGLTNATAISSGGGFTLARRSDGTVWAWGSNTNGQLGNGGVTTDGFAREVVGLAGVASVSAGEGYGLALDAECTLWSWGSNNWGQLGGAPYTDRRVLAAKVGLPCRMHAMAAGGYHGLALHINAPPTADSQSVTATAGAPKGVMLTGADLDGDALTFAVVDPPSHGALTGEPPYVTYTSDPDYAGSDTFTFKASDGTADSSPATVTVTVVSAAKQRVWAWGSNLFGQLGLGWESSVPRELSPFSDSPVIALAAGCHHTLALAADGRLWAWGLNDCGQLGLGDTDARTAPTAVTMPSGQAITKLAAGYNHGLALSADGKVWAWGWNYHGQLGLGDTVDRSVPTEVTFFSGMTVVALSVGSCQSFVLTSDGTLWAWGGNPNGELGLGDTTSRSTPIAVEFFSGRTVTAIATGGGHSLALTSDGSMWSWGANGWGQLGIGDTTGRTMPTQVALPGGAAVAGLATGFTHSLVVTEDGRILACGGNYHGQLGLGDKSNRNALTPLPSLSALGVAAAYVGWEHSFALTASGQVMAWGRDDRSQLGDDGIADRLSPGELAVLSRRGVRSMAGGLSHSLALTANTLPLAADQWVTATACIGKPTALSGSDCEGDPITYSIVSGPSHGALTGTLPDVTYTSDDGFSGMDSFTFKTNDGKDDSTEATVWITVVKADTVTTTVDVRVVWTEDDVVTCHAYLRRAADDAPLPGKTVVFNIGETASAVTDSAGHATVDFTFFLPGTTTIKADFLGDGSYNPSRGTATLTVDNTDTYTVADPVSAQPGQQANLTAVLRRTHDGSPVSYATVHFLVNGTSIGSDTTDASGTAAVTYRVPVGGSADRTIEARFYGNAGQNGSSGTAVLTVGKPDTRTVPTDASGQVGQTVSLTAKLTRADGATPLAGRTVDFVVGVLPVGSSVTGADGVAAIPFHIPDDLASRVIVAGFGGDDEFDGSVNTATLTVGPSPTTLYTIERTCTITENVILRQYDLKRLSDNALLSGKAITYKIDGTVVGSAMTDAGGDSSLNWAIAEGPAIRAITVEFAGDAVYRASSASATLTCTTWSTKMAGFDRTQRIAGRTELKARLLRSDNAPLYNKPIDFSVDGTFVITRPTDVQGYARYAFYDVPDGAGAGARTILSSWAGNGGYVAVSKTATLTVLTALPYIWVLPKTVASGAKVGLYAYFRRLPDYQKQAGKTVDFQVDGTFIASAVTDATGVARYLYQTVEAAGDHAIRCEFAGDAWVEAGYGEGLLRVY